MDNNIIHIEKSNFDLAKQNIRTSLSKVPKSVELEKFREKGTIFSCNNHNVTGSEINQNLVAPLLELLIDQKENTKIIYQTLEGVYETFDKLDNEYIHGILGALKSAEEASNQALVAVNKANIAQKDINNTIDALLITVKNLKEFKDKVTNDLSQLASLSSQILSLKEIIQINEKQFDSIKQKVVSLQSASAKLDKISHLGNIDTIWSDVEEHKVHLSTLDKLLEDLIEEINKKPNAIKNEISEMANAQQEKNEQFDKRIKKAYRIAGWSIALSLGHMLLQWLGVL